jgi:hypothetical protein
MTFTVIAYAGRRSERKTVTYKDTIDAVASLPGHFAWADAWAAKRSAEETKNAKNGKKVSVVISRLELYPVA